jgi:hypothetical protein
MEWYSFEMKAGAGHCMFSDWLDYRIRSSASRQFRKKSFVERFVWRIEYADHAGLPNGTRLVFVIANRGITGDSQRLTDAHFIVAKAL